MKLSDYKIRDITKLLGEGKHLLNKYRSVLFEKDRKLATDFRLPLDKFSVRTSNCLRNNNILTLGDLVALTERDLLYFPNFGRKSLNEVKEFLKPLKIQLDGNRHQIIRSDVLDWNKQLSKLPLINDLINDSPLPLDIFTVRTSNCLRNNNILMLSDLVEFTEQELLYFPNFGRKSLDEVKEFLKPLKIQLNGNRQQVIKNDALDADEQLSNLLKKLNRQKINPLEWSFETYWEKIFDGFDERQKKIISKRYGLGKYSPVTLEEIGNSWGITRERVRQIEAKAQKIIRNSTDVKLIEEFFETRLLSREQPYSINVLSEECQFFSAFPRKPEAYLKFINLICEVPIKIVCFRGDEYLSFISQTKIDAISEKIRVLAFKFSNRSWIEFEKTAHNQYENELKEFFPRTLLDFKKKVVLLKVGDDEIISYISKSNRKTRYMTIAQIIYNASEPLTKEQIKSQSGLTPIQVRGGLSVISYYCKDYGIYPVRHGKWGHISKFGITQKNIEDVITLSKQVSYRTSTQSLHTRQILNASSSSIQVLNEFTIAAILRHFSDMHYLGRNMFAIPESDVESRGRIHDYIVATLKKANKPMHQKELLAEVAKSRSVDLNMQIHKQPPLKNLGNNIWALDIEGFADDYNVGSIT